MGPIRPPSEAGSLLLRVTRNCPWNRCEFCPVYKGKKFGKRPVQDIIDDIDKAAGSGYSFRTAFLQDADSLVIKTPDLVQVVSHLRRAFPEIERVTSYTRVRTIAAKSLEELIKLKKAGLDRVHVGLESGYDALLDFMNKGITSQQAVQGGQKVKAAGLSLCFYVLLGLGGGLRLEGNPAWEKHALETARVLSAVDPDHIRVRTLTVRPGTPLFEKWKKGDFVPADGALTVMEEKLLIENLNVTSRFVSDHVTNVLMEVEGKLPQDKKRMLSLIGDYLDLTGNEQLNFRLGTLFRYTGHVPCYSSFSDFLSSPERPEIAAMIEEMEKKKPGSVAGLIERIGHGLV